MFNFVDNQARVILQKFHDEAATGITVACKTVTASYSQVIIMVG